MSQVEKLVRNVVERSQARIERFGATELNEAQLESNVRLELFAVQGEVMAAVRAEVVARVAEWYAKRPEELRGAC